jgi:hypothetical protein
VEVSLERIGSNFQITMSDSGVGINREFLPFVFGRFSQANTTSARKYGGLGLGLAIVRHLVELHGGTAQADSPGEGQGATFTVTLPVKAARGEMSEFERATLRAETAEPLTDAITLDGLRLRRALEDMDQCRRFVLVSDIGMPGEDGFALISKLRALRPECGRLFLRWR